MDQGHLAVAPGNERGQRLHSLACLAALLKRDRVRGHKEVLVLPVGDGLDGES